MSRGKGLRFASFLALGGLAAGVNWLSRFGWSTVMPFEAAVLCAYATGMVVAFTLFRTFVFPASNLPISVQIRGFVLVNLIGIAVAFVVANVLVGLIFPAIGFRWHAEAIGHGLGIAAPILTSWIGHQRLTFASRNGPAETHAAAEPV